MKHLILTGFMGVGKSTIGPLLASRCNLPFVDSDFQFEKEFKLSPSSYIHRFGIAPFRRWEKQFLRKTLLQEPLVLATGGGMVLQEPNLKWMLVKGYVVWMDVPLPLLLQRLGKKGSRPMLPSPLNLENLENLFWTRKPFYKKCNLRMCNAFESPEKVANQIYQRYKGMS